MLVSFYSISWSNNSIAYALTGLIQIKICWKGGALGMFFDGWQFNVTPTLSEALQHIQREMWDSWHPCQSSCDPSKNRTSTGKGKEGYVTDDIRQKLRCSPRGLQARGNIACHHPVCGLWWPGEHDVRYHGNYLTVLTSSCFCVINNYLLSRHMPLQITSYLRIVLYQWGQKQSLPNYPALTMLAFTSTINVWSGWRDCVKK